jgi:hypothetical protein
MHDSNAHPALARQLTRRAERLQKLNSTDFPPGLGPLFSRGKKALIGFKTTAPRGSSPELTGTSTTFS